MSSPLPTIDLDIDVDAADDSGRRSGYFTWSKDAVSTLLEFVTMAITGMNRDGQAITSKGEPLRMKLNGEKKSFSTAEWKLIWTQLGLREALRLPDGAKPSKAKTKFEALKAAYSEVKGILYELEERSGISYSADTYLGKFEEALEDDSNDKFKEDPERFRKLAAKADALVDAIGPDNLATLGSILAGKVASGLHAVGSDTHQKSRPESRAAGADDDTSSASSTAPPRKKIKAAKGGAQTRMRGRRALQEDVSASISASSDQLCAVLKDFIQQPTASSINVNIPSEDSNPLLAQMLEEQKRHGQRLEQMLQVLMGMHKPN